MAHCRGNVAENCRLKPEGHSVFHESGGVETVFGGVQKSNDRLSFSIEEKFVILVLKISQRRFIGVVFSLRRIGVHRTGKFAQTESEVQRILTVGIKHHHVRNFAVTAVFGTHFLLREIEQP